MGAQNFHRVVMARKFGFAERCVNFLVADMMQQNHRPALAPAQFRDQMVQALRDVRRDRALA